MLIFVTRLKTTFTVAVKSVKTGKSLPHCQVVKSIFLTTLKLPSAEEFEASLDEAQKWAKSVGYNENDVNNIIKSVRKKKRV